MVELSSTSQLHHRSAAAAAAAGAAVMGPRIPSLTNSAADAQSAAAAAAPGLQTQEQLQHLSQRHSFAVETAPSFTDTAPLLPSGHVDSSSGGSISSAVAGQQTLSASYMIGSQKDEFGTAVAPIEEDAAHANEQNGQQPAMSPNVESSHLEAMQVHALQRAAGTSRPLLPSLLALRAMMVLPLLLWFAMLSTGVAHFDGLVSPKEKVQHPLQWFDRYIFRTFGSLLPLMFLATRLAIMLQPRWRKLLRLPAAPVLKTRVSPTSSTTTTQTNGHHQHHHAAQIQQRAPLPHKPRAWQPLAFPTLPYALAAVYLTVLLLRIILYSLHLAVQHRFGRALLSDHVLLGASVLACLQAELVAALSDVTKLEVCQYDMETVDVAQQLRQLGVAAAGVLNAFVCICTCADMYFTGVHYHTPSEMVVSVAMGLVLFQAPIVGWLYWRARSAL